MMHWCPMHRHCLLLQTVVQSCTLNGQKVLPTEKGWEKNHDQTIAIKLVQDWKLNQINRFGPTFPQILDQPLDHWKIFYLESASDLEASRTSQESGRCPASQEEISREDGSLPDFDLFFFPESSWNLPPKLTWETSPQNSHKLKGKILFQKPLFQKKVRRDPSCREISEVIQVFYKLKMREAQVGCRVCTRKVFMAIRRRERDGPSGMIPGGILGRSWHEYG